MYDLKIAAKISCPACETSVATEWGADQGIPIYECTSCSTIYFSRPITNINSYENYYPYLNNFSDDRFQKELAIRDRQSQNKLRNIENILSKRNLRILDVGSGPGYFAKTARERGHDAICGELNNDAIRQGQLHFGNKFVDIFEDSIGQFDAITLFHVIEHLERPDIIISRSMELLRPGGLLYIHVPIGASVSSLIEARIKSLVRPDYKRRGCLYLPDHVTGFSESGIIKFFQKFDLRDIQVDRLSMFSGEYDPLFFEFRNNTFTGISLLGLELVRGLCDVIFGGSWLRCVARKRLT